MTAVASPSCLLQTEPGLAQSNRPAGAIRARHFAADRRPAPRHQRTQPRRRPRWRSRCSRRNSSRLPRKQPFHVDLPHSHNPLVALQAQHAPPLDLTNSPRLESLIRDGKLYISLSDAIALAIENNLDLAYFRYNFPIAQTDYPAHQSRRPGERRQHRHRAVSTQGGFGGRKWRRGREFRIGCCRRGRYRDLDPRRRNRRHSFDPFLTSRLRRSHRHSGGQPVPGTVSHILSRTPLRAGELHPVVSHWERT